MKLRNLGAYLHERFALLNMDLAAVHGRIVAALFPGLIEWGAARSHAIILLRELGIPAISNVPGLRQHPPSGQQCRWMGARVKCC